MSTHLRFRIRPLSQTLLVGTVGVGHGTQGIIITAAGGWGVRHAGIALLGPIKGGSRCRSTFRGVNISRSGRERGVLLLLLLLLLALLGLEEESHRESRFLFIFLSFIESNRKSVVPGTRQGR